MEVKLTQEEWTLLLNSAEVGIEAIYRAFELLRIKPNEDYINAHEAATAVILKVQKQFTETYGKGN